MRHEKRTFPAAAGVLCAAVMAYGEQGAIGFGPGQTMDPGAFLEQAELIGGALGAPVARAGSIEGKAGGRIGSEIVWKRIEGTDVNPLPDWKACGDGEGFCMGTDNGFGDDQPVHKVKVPTFELAETLVTVAQYAKCVKAGVCSEPVPHGRNGSCNWGRSGWENHPVNCVNVKQAETFARWAGGRLPTEAEFEFAATSRGKNRKYPWGNEAPTSAHAVFNPWKGASHERPSRRAAFYNAGTMPVGSKEAGKSEQGVYDLAGNVSEWLQDIWHHTYDGAPSDARAWVDSGDAPYRVIRGGSWYDSFSLLRADRRYEAWPDDPSREIGFRLARTELPTPDPRKL